MWVIKNIKYKNYYNKTISKNDRHFVSYIEEAKKMNKTTANKLLNSFNKPYNYELVKVSR